MKTQEGYMSDICPWTYILGFHLCSPRADHAQHEPWSTSSRIGNQKTSFKMLSGFPDSPISDLGASLPHSFIVTVYFRSSQANYASENADLIWIVRGYESTTHETSQRIFNWWLSWNKDLVGCVTSFEPLISVHTYANRRVNITNKCSDISKRV